MAAFPEASIGSEAALGSEESNIYDEINRIFSQHGGTMVEISVDDFLFLAIFNKHGEGGRPIPLIENGEGGTPKPLIENNAELNQKYKNRSTGIGPSDNTAGSMSNTHFFIVPIKYNNHDLLNDPRYANISSMDINDQLASLLLKSIGIAADTAIDHFDLEGNFKKAFHVWISACRQYEDGELFKSHPKFSSSLPNLHLHVFDQNNLTNSGVEAEENKKNITLEECIIYKRTKQTENLLLCMNGFKGENSSFYKGKFYAGPNVVDGFINPEAPHASNYLEWKKSEIGKNFEPLIGFSSGLSSLKGTAFEAEMFPEEGGGTRRNKKKHRKVTKKQQKKRHKATKKKKPKKKKKSRR